MYLSAALIKLLFPKVFCPINYITRSFFYKILLTKSNKIEGFLLTLTVFSCESFTTSNSFLSKSVKSKFGKIFVLFCKTRHILFLTSAYLICDFLQQPEFSSSLAHIRKFNFGSIYLQRYYV